MALPEIKQALELYFRDQLKLEGDLSGLASLFIKTKVQQKAILQAWSTSKKTALTTQKANLAVVKTQQEAIIDSEIANITDLETNF